MASSTGIGVIFSKRLKEKCLICSELASFCDSMLIDLEYSVTPVTDLVNKLKGSYRHIDFLNYECIINRTDISTPLSKAENGEISCFLNSLGKSDVKAQIKLVSGFREYIKAVEEKYSEEYSRYSKIYLSFGFFGGVILSLILI